MNETSDLCRGLHVASREYGKAVHDDLGIPSTSQSRGNLTPRYQDPYLARVTLMSALNRSFKLGCLFAIDRKRTMHRAKTC